MRREISPLEDWNAVGEIKRLICEFKPDAIHLNSSKMGVLGALAARGVHARVVYRIGGWAFLEPIPEWKRWIYRAAEQQTAKDKDVIITVHPGDEALAKRPNYRAVIDLGEAWRDLTDLPFVFAIVDDATATVLFAGVIADPSRT